MSARPRLPATSLRRRALLPTLGGALTLFATTIVLLQVMLAQQLSERIRSRSATVAHMVANAVESEQDPVQLRRTVTALGAEPLIDLIVVTMGPSHEVLAATRSEWSDRTLQEIGESRLATQVGSALASTRESGARLHDGGGMSYVVPIRREAASGRPEHGAVVVVVNDGALRAQSVHWLWRIGAAVLALEILALAAAEFALRRYILRPIQAIARAARKMRAGDRTARAPVYADDELGRLATTLNEGHAGLNASIKELEFQQYALDQAATVLVTDAQSVIQYVNDAYCRLAGYTRDELVGQNPRIVNSGHHPLEFFRQMFETVSAGGVWRGELCNRAKDGRLYWANSTIIPTLDAAGRPVRYTAVLYDVSERKLAELEARAADARFRDMANAAPVLIWMADVDKRCTFFNLPWLQFTGRTHEQECGDGWAEGVHPDDLPRCLATYVEAFDLRQPFEMEYRLRRHDGAYRLILDKGVPRFSDGVFCGYAGSCIDITERAGVERDLRASEARTRQIVDTAIDAVVTVDDDARITSWNIQAEKLFGWTAAEAIGGLLAETIVPPQYRVAHSRGFARFLRTGEGNVLGHRLEITALRRNGEEFPVELSISAMPLEHGMFFSAFIRDISERRRVETELVCAKDAAQSASRAKSEFLAMMSHEIRTPMNGVIGFTDLLIDSGLDAAQREYAETIRSSGQALLALINDILDFSKIEAGKLDVERVPFDARRAAAEVVELLSARAEESGIEVVFDWPASVPHQLVGDAMRFRQVLLNLAGNALKFTTEGAVFVRAERDAQGGLRMQVRDTGIGIAEDKLGNLFRRFSQADSSTTRRFGGTGLGLAISKQLVELMGGTIGAESQPGHGSTFWFTLLLPAELAATLPPIDLPATRVTPPAPVARPARGTSGLIARMRVLLAEDHPVNQKLALRVLGKLGCAVDLSQNGIEACALAAATDYDLILMDCHMPEMDGFEATVAIRAREAASGSAGTPARHTPIVALTASVLQEDRDRCISSGMDDFLCKPFRPDQLRSALERWAPRDNASEGPLREAA